MRLPDDGSMLCSNPAPDKATVEEGRQQMIDIWLQAGLELDFVKAHMNGQSRGSMRSQLFAFEDWNRRQR